MKVLDFAQMKNGVWYKNACGHGSYLKKVAGAECFCLYAKDGALIPISIRTINPVISLLFDCNQFPSIFVEDIDDNRLYMIFVQSKNSPTIIHTGFEKANKEAERLAIQFPNHKVYILEVSKVIQAKVTTQIKDVTVNVKNDVQVPF